MYYYGTDFPGNVTGLVNSSGTVVNEYRYTPWGEVEAKTEGTTNPLHYMAREIDGSTGLYYVRNRWYDAALGRFLSEDPIGLGGGINWYTYAGNSPVNLRDPLGLCVANSAALVENGGYCELDGVTSDGKDRTSGRNPSPSCRGSCGTPATPEPGGSGPGEDGPAGGSRETRGRGRMRHLRNATGTQGLPIKRA